MKIGVVLAMPDEKPSVRELIRRSVEAERDGIESIWLPQVFGIDSLTVLAMAAQETRTVELGTAVIPIQSRHPTVLASQALTVQSASAGRLTLGIGVSHRFLVERMLGLDYVQPADRAAEYLEVLLGLLAGKDVRFDGRYYSVRARIDVADAEPPPILLAALRPRMARLAGMHASGTVTLAAGLTYLRDFLIPALRSSAALAARPMPRVVAMLPVAVGDAIEERKELSERFRTYGDVSAYRAILRQAGASGIEDTAVVGDEESVFRQLSELAERGVTDLVVIESSRTVDATRRLLRHWRDENLHRGPLFEGRPSRLQ